MQTFVEFTSTTAAELPHEIALARVFAAALAGQPGADGPVMLAHDGSAPELPGAGSNLAAPQGPELQHRLVPLAELAVYARAHGLGQLAEFLARPVSPQAVRLVVLSKDWNGAAVCEPAPAREGQA